MEDRLIASSDNRERKMNYSKRFTVLNNPKEREREREREREFISVLPLHVIGRNEYEAF